MILRHNTNEHLRIPTRSIEWVHSGNKQYRIKIVTITFKSVKPKIHTVHLLFNDLTPIWALNKSRHSEVNPVQIITRPGTCQHTSCLTMKQAELKGWSRLKESYWWPSIRKCLMCARWDVLRLKIGKSPCSCQSRRDAPPNASHASLTDQRRFSKDWNRHLQKYSWSQRNKEECRFPHTTQEMKP